MLATIYASRLLQLHLIPFTLPLSLNSLDLVGVRLLSPRDSPDTSKTSLQEPMRPVQVLHPSSRRSSMKTLFIVLFRSSRSVVEPSWGRSWTFVAFGVLLLFWLRSRALIVL